MTFTFLAAVQHFELGGTLQGRIMRGFSLVFQIADHLGVPSKMTALSINMRGSEPSHHCNHTSHNSDQVHVKVMNSIPHLEKNKDNTFQCMVTVHREMSQ